MTEPTDEMKKEFEYWLDGRPEIIKKIANKIPPWNKYRLKPTGQHCSMYSYYEDGTVTIVVNGHDSEFLDMANVSMPFTVFGIDPNDLELIEA